MVFLNEQVHRRREWHAKFNQGANGARTGKKFSSTLRISLKIKSLFKCWACLRQLQCTVFAVVLSQNLIKVQLARALAKSFRRASRSPAVQVTGSANALSRWDRAQAH